jgi:hypothetical protein
VSQIPSDGRFAVSNDRLTHAAVAASNVHEHGNMAIYGFGREDVSALVPLARFWNRPPRLSDIEGGTSPGYDKAQRAYVLNASRQKLSFSLRASEQAPLVNPAFVVKNWQSNRTAVVSINGQEVTGAKECRQGMVRDTNGQPMLIVWVNRQSNEPLDVAISANID